MCHHEPDSTHIALQLRVTARRKPVSCIELTSYAHQVACGMAYLEQQRVAHGDLCAFAACLCITSLSCHFSLYLFRRNVLLKSGNDGVVCCKISEFGHAEDLYTELGLPLSDSYAICS